MLRVSRIAKCLVTASAIVIASLAHPAAAAITWDWSYSGTNTNAFGIFTTGDTADASGFYQITGITGSRNGENITALFPTGQPIPGNAPFAIDNLVRVNAQGQLTGDGFGFTTEGGNHANPFFADFLTPPGYLEVFTTPAGGFFETPITFTARIVPEPGVNMLLLAGMGMLVGVSYTRRRGTR